MERQVSVGHILYDGQIVDHCDIEEKLLDMSGGNADDFFASRHERLATAYKMRARKVAFQERKSDAIPSEAAE